MEAAESADPLGIAGSVEGERLRFGELVGRRGVTTIHRATHLELGRPVLVELLDVAQPAETSVLADLRREAGILHDLALAGGAIPRVLGVSALTTPAGRWVPYVIREDPGGDPIDMFAAAWRERQGRAPSLAEVMAWLDPVARALASAHRMGLAHRELAPDRIVVATLGGEPRASLLGFSLVPSERKAPAFAPTHGAPEHFDPAFGEPGARSDVFALALITAELLAGRRGLRGESPGALCLSSTAADDRPTPRRMGVELGEAAESVFRSALAVKPEDRPADAGALWAQLTRAAVETTRPRDPEASPPSRRAAEPPGTGSSPAALPAVSPRMVRKWIAIGVGIAVLIAMVPLGVVLYLWSAQPPARKARAPRAKVTATASAQASTPGAHRALALTHAAAGRTTEALLEVRELLRISPGSAADAAIAEIVNQAARETGPPREEAFALMESGMGAHGPDLLLAIAMDSTAPSTVREDAEKSLAKKKVARGASKAVRVAMALRAARNPCDRKEHLERAREEGDERSLPSLTPLLATDGCGFLGTGDCYKCLGDRSQVRAAIEAIQARGRPPRR
jgi:hypothetical protein